MLCTIVKGLYFTLYLNVILINPWRRNPSFGHVSVSNSWYLRKGRVILTPRSLKNQFLQHLTNRIAAFPASLKELWAYQECQLLRHG